MSGYVGDLSPKQEKAFEKFKENITDVIQPDHDDAYLLRWLRARHWDVGKAEKMIRNSHDYKKKMRLDELCKTWQDPEVIEKYFVGGLCGFAKNGSPIWIDPFGNIDPKGIIYSSKSSDIVKSKLVLSETVHRTCAEQTKKLGKRVDRCVVIFDLENVTIHHIWKPFIDLYGQVLAIFEANYPEALDKCFITRAPRFFSVGYNMVKPFLSDDTKKKVYILGSNFKEELLKHIDADQLPEHFGGTLKDEDGDPRYRTKVCYGGKIPESYYLKDKHIDEDIMETATIGRGAILDLDYSVTEPGSHIRYEFQSEGADIAFGIFKKNADSSLAEVLPVSRCKSNIVLEDGTFRIDEPGNYVVRFDNSFSWIKSKKLKYLVEVLPPDKEIEDQLGDDATVIDLVHGISTQL